MFYPSLEMGGLVNDHHPNALIIQTLLQKAQFRVTYIFMYTVVSKNYLF
jgi:hypothetical protein